MRRWRMLRRIGSGGCCKPRRRDAATDSVLRNNPYVIAVGIRQSARRRASQSSPALGVGKVRDRSICGRGGGRGKPRRRHALYGDLDSCSGRLRGRTSVPARQPPRKARGYLVRRAFARVTNARPSRRRSLSLLMISVKSVGGALGNQRCRPCRLTPRFPKATRPGFGRTGGCRARATMSTCT